MNTGGNAELFFAKTIDRIRERSPTIADARLDHLSLEYQDCVRALLEMYFLM